MTDADRMGDWLQTYSGGRFYPLDPRADEVNPDDIAHALSLLCRFGGHINDFYSVAEHCVLVARFLLKTEGPTAALWGLLHDATEAYVIDVPRPLKRHLVGYGEIEAGVMSAITEYFELDGPMPQSVYEADHRILLTERNALMRNHERWVNDDTDEPLPVDIYGWDPSVAEAKYTTTLNSLLS